MKKLKKGVLAVLVFTMVVSAVQHKRFITFAADVAKQGNYVGEDFTGQETEVNQVENQPENEVEQPERTVGEFTSRMPYEELLEKGWKEIKEERAGNKKVVEDPITGERRTFMYLGDIHYRDGNGKWQDYDTDLTVQRSMFRSNALAYTQTAGDVDLSIPASINALSPITIRVKGAKVAIVPDRELKDPQVRQNAATYKASDSQDTLVVNLGGGLMINEKYYADMPEEISYSYQINEGYSLTATAEKTSISIIHDKTKETVGVMHAPKVVDANKEPYTNVSTIEAIKDKEENQYTIKVNLSRMAAYGSVAAYPVDVSSTVSTITHGDVQIYAIDSHQPDVTYGPGGGGRYQDMFIIGNSDNPMYFPTGIFKAFVTTSVPNWKNFIGENRQITNATFHMFEYTHSAATYPDSSEIKALRIENDYQGRPNTVTWNKWINSHANLTAVTSKWASKTDDDFVPFDITSAVKDWYGGAPDYGLMLDTTRDNEGLIFLNHDWSNHVLDKWGGKDGRPYIEITHQKAEPVSGNLELNKTTLNIRPFTTSVQGGTLHFQALGFDGVARPGAMVDIQVYEANNASKIAYNTTSMPISGYRQYPYYEPPIYPAIENAQKYYGLCSNYQSTSLLYAKDLKKDVLYQIRYRTRTLNSDGSIKEASNWTNSDTFQLYTAKGMDHMPRILNFYGLSDKILFMKDNHMRDELIVESNQVFLRNPKKNQNKAYIMTPLSEKDKKNIDGYLMGQGKHCEFGYEPINFNTGNFYYQNSDASFIDFDKEMKLERHYNSMAGGVESIFGRNWEFSWNKQLIFLSNGDAFFLDGTGKRIKFTKQGSSYSVQGSEPLSLTKKQIRTIPYTEESGYYDTVEGTPITTTIQVPVYQYSISDTSTGKVYTFHDNGTIETIKMDRYNHYMIFAYNDQGHPVKMTSPSGKSITFSYDANGYINKITLPDGNTLQYSYDSLGNLVTFTDQEGHTLQYLYEDTRNPYAMTSYKSRMDKQTMITNTYDTSGRITRQVDAKGDTVHLNYYSDRTEIKDFDGKKQIIYIDSVKRTTKVVNTDGSVKQQEYDGKNNLIKDAPSDKPVTRYTYDARGNILSETREDGKTKTYTYNSLNLPTSMTEYDGSKITSEYDGYGNMTAIHYPDGSSKTYGYDGNGQLLKETDRNGNNKMYGYTSGNKISDSDSHGTKSYSYDAMGRIVSETDAMGNRTVFGRNRRGELVSVQKPNGTSTYQYNADGEKVWQKDANGNVTRFAYDSWSRLMARTDSYGTVKYEYDAKGNVTKQIDELKNETRYIYDASNNLVKIIHPDTSEQTFQYDYRGHVIESSDALGNTTTFTYDAILDRLLKITGPDGNSTALLYDVLGNMTAMTYPDGSSEEYVYDTENRVIESTNRMGVKTTYRYDHNGNVLLKTTEDHSEKSQYGKDDVEIKRVDSLGQIEDIIYNKNKLIDKITLKNGGSLSYRYDSNYNITKIVDANGIATTRTYDGSGNMTSETDGSGNTTSYTYTSRNQIAAITNPDGGVVQYVYDAAGNKIEEVDPLGYSTKYEYDSMHRVIKVIDARGNETAREYDKAGQLIKVTNPLGQETTYQYNEIGQIIEKREYTGLIIRYTYDSNGNVTEQRDNFERYTVYQYDALGHILATSNWKGETTENTYDDYGNMIVSTDKRGNKSTYKYDGNNALIKMVDAQENVTQYTLNEIGQPASILENEETIENVYNQTGQLVESRDQNDQLTTYSYDASNRMTSITLPNGGTELREYSSTGLLEKTTDPNGGVSESVYDKKGQLLASIDPEGNRTQYQYDEVGNLIMVVDPLGYAITYEYDALNRTVKTTDKKGNVEETTYTKDNQVASRSNSTGTYQYEYNEKGLLVTAVDAMDRETIYSYNDYDQLSEIRYPNGYEEYYSYNIFGDVLKVSNNVDKKPSEENTYNVFGQLIEKTDSKGNRTEYTYTAKGLISKVTEANGNTITYEYDSLDRMIRMKDIRGNTTEYSYNALDQVIAVKYPGDREYTYSYDLVGNLVTETDPMKSVTAYAYNKNNQQLTKTDARGNTESMGYDERGNIASISDALGNETSYQYDANSNVTLISDALGYETKYQYDEANRLITVRDREEIETSYSYDAESNLTSITNGNGAVTTYEYDSSNQLIKAVQANGDIEEFAYDLKGNVTEETKSDGRTIAKQYDALNNLIYEGYDDKKYEYQYNDENQIVSVTNKDTHTRMTYNSYGDLLSYSEDGDHVIQYIYDDIGQKTGILYPDGREIEYRYDANGRLIEVKDGEQITTYRYDALGNKIEMTLPNGAVTRYEYDVAGQLTKLETTSETGNILTSMSYSYDARGNISKAVEAIEGIETIKEYSYDGEEKLIASRHTSEDLTREYRYRYDRAGNRIEAAETVEGKETRTEYTFNESNALIEARGQQSVEYSYDEAGHVKEKRYADGIIETYLYDAKGQLVEMQSTNGKTITYSYDGFGNRISKQESTSIESSEESGYDEYLDEEGKRNEDYDQKLAIETMDEKLASLEETIVEHSQDIYQPYCRSTTLDNSKTSIETLYYINDLNQEYTQVLQTANQSGETIDSYIYGNERIAKSDNYETGYYSYDGNGNVVGQITLSNPEDISYPISYSDYGRANHKVDNEYGYNGELHDYHGMQYLRARNYDSHAGVFQQLDSYRGRTESPITQNRYAYAHNNPINLKDPSGHYVAFDDPDDDAISRRMNANEKVGKQTSWDAEKDKHFVNRSSAKSAYEKKAAKSAQGAAEFNRNYIKGCVEAWQGESGSIARKHYESLLASGNYTEEQAYKIARELKKVCDEINSTHLNELYTKIKDMDNQQVYDFFGMHKVEKANASQRYDTVIGSSQYYSPFMNFLNSHRTAWEEVKAVFGGFAALSIAASLPLMVGAGASLGLGLTQIGILGWGAITGNYVLFTEAYYTSFSLYSVVESMNKKQSGETNFYIGPDGTAFTTLEQADEYYTSIYGSNWQAYFNSQSPINNDMIPPKTEQIIDPDGDGTLGVSGDKIGQGSNNGVGNPVKIEGRGSTGRTVPNNLNEQMAMEQVKSNPLNGATDTKLTLGDTRWPSSEGWTKMQNIVTTSDGSKITIHFNYNPNGNLFDDFKFVFPK